MTFKTLNLREIASEPRTLGEHIRRCRLVLRLTQKQLATRLGVNPWTILNWEKGYTSPPIAAIPVILAWLGYDPYPEPATLSERLMAKRRSMGWSIKEAARLLGVDEGTWAAWELGSLGTPFQGAISRDALKVLFELERAALNSRGSEGGTRSCR